MLWTKEQQQAIDARNHTILVSAAAGSGKTAVLVERIVQLIREGYSVSRMLIVTFTRAAAAEMRQRLANRLSKEAQMFPDTMSGALDELESCEISTIHAFCQHVLRNEFQAVEIDPQFRICEENERQNLFELAFCDAMNELLEDENQPDFAAFADAFEQQAIREMNSSLYRFLMSIPEPFAWMHEQIDHIVDEPFAEHPWYQILVREAERQIYSMGDLLEAQRRMFDEADAVQVLKETWEADMEAYQRVIQYVDVSRETFYEHLASFGFVRAAACRGLNDAEQAWKKRYTDLRKQMKDLVTRLVGYLSLQPDKLRHEWTTMQQHLRGLAVLVEKTHAYFLQYKQQKNVVDFGDLEQMTYDILTQETKRASLQAAYDHIFVDECQDVSAIQDAILQALHGENSCLFMVGDVKQSIYRFRLADPTRFLTRMRTFSSDPDARERRIFLQKNFRSRPAVLNATNQVFRHLMRPNVTELDYLPEDELIPGRKTLHDPPVELYVLDTEEQKETEKEKSIVSEAALVVQRVQELLETPYPEEERCYTYRDMVILLPKTAGVGTHLVELLSQHGIPAYFDGADNYFQLPEIVTIRSLLAVIDNPLQDIALLAALKALPFGLTDEDLAAIRLCSSGRNVPFYEAFGKCCEQDSPLGRHCSQIQAQFRQWHFQAEVMRLPDFLWELMRTSGFYAACGALPKGELRQANLRLFCQRAVIYEQNGGCSLSGFLALTEQQKQADDQQSAKMLGENENLIRIMTIHKSKGLEFPIVFCLQLSNKLHVPGGGKLKTHNRLGLCLPYVNRALNISRQTLADEAFDIQRKLDEKAERARLLYVAMTRAKERLILIGSTPKSKRSCWYLPENDYRIIQADSMTDWLMQAIVSECPTMLSTDYPQAETPWNIRLLGQIHRPFVDKKEVIHMAPSDLLSPNAAALVNPPWEEELSPVDDANAIPLKTSVSSLVQKKAYHDPLPMTDAEEDTDTKCAQEALPLPLLLSELPSRPSFMEERKASGAYHGTLMHRVLSLLSLPSLRKAPQLLPCLRAQTEQMVQHGLLTEEEMKNISINQLHQFYTSPLGQRLLASPEVRREWSFNLLLPSGTLLQGVIDCAFQEENHWILLDYKTDHGYSESELISKYCEQLHWYKKALEQLTHQPVIEQYIYSFANHASYSIPQENQ